MAGPVGASPPPEPEERPLARRPPLTRHAKQYTGRFRVAYVALALVFWIVVGGGTFALTRGVGGDEQAWSSWRPESHGFDAAREIAAHVQAQYKLDDGSQLVAVQAHKPEIQNVPLAAVALRNGDDVKVIPADDSVVYVLCGLGERCAIDRGEATIERARLLRREALEIALYTFKYVKGVDSVIALLPPPPNEANTNWSLFFRKGEVEHQLDRPLRSTLPIATSLTPSRGVETSTIEELTRRRWFRSQFQQLQDGDAILVLDPLTAQS